MRSPTATPGSYPVTQFPQDFTSLQTYGPTLNVPDGATFASYAPLQMCPPMEWDVYYKCRWAFSGKPNSMAAARLAQS